MKLGVHSAYSWHCRPQFYKQTNKQTNYRNTQSFTFQKPQLNQQINGVFYAFLKISFHLFPHLLPHLLCPYLLFHDLMAPCISSLNLGHQLSLVHPAQWEEPWETTEDNLIIPSSRCRPPAFHREAQWLPLSCWHWVGNL